MFDAEQLADKLVEEFPTTEKLHWLTYFITKPDAAQEIWDIWFPVIMPTDLLREEAQAMAEEGLDAQL